MDKKEIRRQQNREAQNKFRKNKLEQVEKLKQAANNALKLQQDLQKEQQLAMKLQQEIQELKNELQQSLEQRDSMIHIVDKLRSDNYLLCTENTRLKSNITVQKKTNYSVKGRGNLKHLHYTSLKDTFLDSSGNGRPNGVFGANMSSSNGTNNKSSSNGTNSNGINMSRTSSSRSNSSLNTHLNIQQNTQHQSIQKSTQPQSIPQNPSFMHWTPPSQSTGDPNQSYLQSFNFQDTPSSHKLPFYPRIDATSSSSLLLHHIPFQQPSQQQFVDLNNQNYYSDLPISLTNGSNMFHHVKIERDYLPVIKKRDKEMEFNCFVPEKEF